MRNPCGAIASIVLTASCTFQPPGSTHGKAAIPSSAEGGAAGVTIGRPGPATGGTTAAGGGSTGGSAGTDATAGHGGAETSLGGASAGGGGISAGGTSSQSESTLSETTLSETTSSETTSSETTSVAAGGSGSDSGPDPFFYSVDLGVVSPGETFEFTIPEHTTGFALVAEGTHPADLAGIEFVSSPTKEMASEYTYVGAAVYTAGYGLGLFTYPLVAPTNAAVEAGTWTASALQESFEPVSARLWVRTTADGAYHGGVLDVNVISSDVAPQNHWQKVIRNAAAAHGYSVGTVRFIDNALSAEDAYVSSDDQVFDLAAKYSPLQATAPALNILVVEYASSLGVLGIAPLPGLADASGRVTERNDDDRNDGRRARLRRSLPRIWASDGAPSQHRVRLRTRPAQRHC